MSFIKRRLSTLLSGKRKEEGRDSEKKSNSKTSKRQSVPVTYSPPAGPPPDPTAAKITYLPPPGPPPGVPHLKSFPFITPEDVPTFYSQGYARVHFPPDHPLMRAAEAMFGISRTFFATAKEHKEQFHLSKLAPKDYAGHNSEEGWSRVEGEKEMITVRRVGPLTPAEVVDQSKELWKQCGVYMTEMVGVVEKSLELPEGSLMAYVKDEVVLPDEGKRHETLMRMFRYERKEGEPRLVSAQHKDLGILSLVIGSSPGLEVWNERTRQWVPIEEQSVEGAPMENTTGLTVSVLVGQILTRLTNSRYKPGVHRVFVPPPALSSKVEEGSEPDLDTPFRYSLVYALRPFRQAPISTRALTTPITGEFQYPIEGATARDLFNAIADSHWSVNDSEEVRAKQRAKMQQKIQAMTTQAEATTPTGEAAPGQVEAEGNPGTAPAPAAADIAAQNGVQHASPVPAAA